MKFFFEFSSDKNPLESLLYLKKPGLLSLLYIEKTRHIWYILPLMIVYQTLHTLREILLNNT